MFHIHDQDGVHAKFSQTLGHCVYETDIRRLTSGESSPAKLNGTWSTIWQWVPRVFFMPQISPAGDCSKWQPQNYSGSRQKMSEEKLKKTLSLTKRPRRDQLARQKMCRQWPHKVEKKPTVPLSALDTNSVLSSLRNYRMWSTEAYTGHLEYFISFNGSNILPGESSAHPALTTHGWQTLLTEAVWLAQVGKFLSGRNGTREQVHQSLIPH